MKCSVCGKEPVKVTHRMDGQVKLPAGWKASPANEPVCGKCWKRIGRTITISLPVKHCVNRTWPEFTAALKQLWQQSTFAANTMVTTMSRMDVVRQATDAKLGKASFKSADIYKAVRTACPDMHTGSLSGLQRGVEAKYQQKRFQTIWTGQESMPRYRYPQPAHIRKVEWQLEIVEGCPKLTFSLASGDRFIVTLRSGGEFARQVAVLKKVVSGDALRGTLQLTRQISHGSRATVQDRGNGGENRGSFRIMARIAVWMPTQAVKGMTGDMYVTTGGDVFLKLAIGDDVCPPLHAEHVRYWTREHARRLQVLADDTKYEKRVPVQTGIMLQAKRETWCNKHHRRLDTFVKQTAAMVVGMAARRGVARVVYTDKDKSFTESFPWFILRERLQTVLSASGIAFQHVEDAVAPAEAAT